MAREGSAANVISKPLAAAGKRLTSTSLVIISPGSAFVRNVPGDASSESIAGSRNHLVSEAEAFAARLDGRLFWGRPIKPNAGGILPPHGGWPTGVPCHSLTEGQGACAQLPS